MGKFDIEPCRGITDPNKESHIRVRSKIRKENREKIKKKQNNDRTKGEFGGEDLAVFK